MALVLPEGADAGSEHAVLPQLRGELGAAGFAVVLVSATSPLSRDGLEDAARSSGCFAAIGIAEPSGEPALDIWVADRVTGKTVLRRIDAPADSRQASALVSLRAAELLRASLLELNLERSPRGEVSAEPEIQAWVKPPSSPPLVERPPAERTPRRARFGVAVGAAAFVAPGGLPPAVAPGIVLSWRAAHDWVGELAAFAPALSRIEGANGSATVDQELGLVGARLELGNAPFRPSVGLAAGAFRLGARGAARPPLRGSADQSWSFAAALAVGARAELASGLALVTDVRALGLFPQPVVRFAGEVVAETGRPLIVAGFAGELTW